MTRECRWCKKTIDNPNSPRQVFCSVACRSKSYRTENPTPKKATEKRPRKPMPRILPPNVCKLCEVRLNHPHVTTPDDIFCSWCHKEYPLLTKTPATEIAQDQGVWHRETTKKMAYAD